MYDMILGRLGSGAVLLAMQATQTYDYSNDSAHDVWNGWGSVILALGVISIVAIIVSILIWQIFKTNQNRYSTNAMLARDEAYRKLAEELAASQEQAVEDLASLRRDTADVRQRVASIERMLRDVE